MEYAMDRARNLKLQLTERANVRKGLRRSAGPQLTRNQLLAAGALPYYQSSGDTKFTVFLKLYAPSVIPLQDLEKIYLNDLRLETRHQGSVLVVRTFGQAVDASAIQTFVLVEDECNEVDRAAIFNFGLATWPQTKVPPGAVMAIKEPFFRSVSEDTGMALGIDHPSDVIFLEDDHPMYPSKWIPSAQRKTAVYWKSEGNNALKQKDYIKANYCYSKGASALDLELNLKHDLLRNRAQVGLSLDHYEAVKADAMASLSGNDDDRSKDSKALWLAGRAAYELSDYQQASELFHRMLDLTPLDDDGKRELARTKLRLTEEENGVFDFAAMLKRTSTTGKYHIEKASHLRRTVIRSTQVSGRGLYATQPIKAGDIILCEKAFIASNTPSIAASLSFMIDPIHDREMYGSHVAIWIEAVRKIFNNPSLSHHLLDLHDGKPTRREGSTAPMIVDSMPVIDVFRFPIIIEYNSFAFIADKHGVCKNNDFAGTDSCGVWPQASYPNHNCLFNANRSFIGDFMVVRANKDIGVGEEITTIYRPMDGNYEQLQSELQRGWGFDVTFLQTYSISAITRMMADDAIPAGLVEKAQRLLNEVHKTYPQKLFVPRAPQSNKIVELLPTMGKARLHLWLMCAHYHQPSLALKYALFVLADHGYMVKINREVGISIDHTNCNLTIDAVQAMGYIEHHYDMMNEPKCAKTARTLSEELYATLKGSMVGFKSLVDDEE